MVVINVYRITAESRKPLAVEYEDVQSSFIDVNTPECNSSILFDQGAVHLPTSPTAEKKIQRECTESRCFRKGRWHLEGFKM
jgi:hypothetical protein